MWFQTKSWISSPFHGCVRIFNADALQILVDVGVAKVDIKDVDRECLSHVSATRDTKGFLEVLLHTDANPDAIEKDWFSVIIMTTRYAQCDYVKFLLEAGANAHCG